MGHGGCSVPLSILSHGSVGTKKEGALCPLCSASILVVFPLLLLLLIPLLLLTTGAALVVLHVGVLGGVSLELDGGLWGDLEFHRVCFEYPLIIVGALWGREPLCATLPTVTLNH